MKATFLRSEQLSSNIWSFYFKPNSTLTYLAGQFIELTLQLPETSSDKPKRWFTLSSSPTEPELAITTRISTNDRSDFKNALHNLNPGEIVDISQAMGDFVLPRDPNIHLIFIAGGIGITPFRSMIKYLSDTHQYNRMITVIHCLRNMSDKVFESSFYNFRCTYLPTTARLDAAGVRKLVELTDDERVYISGPEPFVETLRDDFISNNFSEGQIIGDYFPGYPLDQEKD